jgi:FkbM family methyltransferase
VLAPRFAVALRERLQVTAPLDYAGASLRLHADSSLELASRVNACRKEPETVAWIERHARLGDVLYDIGANVGAYSLVAAVRQGVRVYAFEPAFPNFAQLSRNVILNECSGRVMPLHVALHDSTGLIEFNFSDLTTGTALHSLGGSVDQKGHEFSPVARQPVLAYRLDDFVRQFQLPGPTLVKLDVDGHERRVIDGATAVLSCASLRSLLIELEPSGPDTAACLARLGQLGLQETARYPHGDAEGATVNAVFERIPTGNRAR